MKFKIRIKLAGCIRVKRARELTCPIFFDSALKLAVIPVIVSMGDVQVVTTLGGRCLNTERDKVIVMFYIKFIFLELLLKN